MKARIKMFDRVPTRYVIAAAILINCIVDYIYRVNISLNIIAMVPEKGNSTTVKSECAALLANQTSVIDSSESLMLRRRTPEDSIVFDWTAQQQAYVLAGYFWGYFLTCFVGGPLAELWGPRNLVFFTTLLSALLTILSLQCAKIHYSVMVANRIIVGFASGTHFPALHSLIVEWAPPSEKSLIASLLGGGSIGTILTWSLTGPLIDNYGWEYAFYIAGAIVVVWSLIWWYVVYDSPLVHPRISESEKKFLSDVIGDTVQRDTSKVIPPIMSMFKSPPFLALILLQFGNAWGFYFAMTAAPKYVSTALGFNLTSTGGLSSLPYLARVICLPLFGALGDAIVRRNLISITALRKSFTVISHIIPGLLLASLGYAGCSPYLSVAIITMTLGVNGAVSVTSLVNNHDLAPNYAGTIFGITNGFASTSGFITPLLTAHFTKTGNGFAEWRSVFTVGFSVYIITGILFILFGSGKVQKWNEIKVKDEKKKDNKPADTIETLP